MSNTAKDDVIVLGEREFKRVKNGLDEAQVASFIDELIKDRDKLTQSQDHIASLNRLAERTVVEADKLAAQIKTEAAEQAKAESAAIIDKAKEQARQTAEKKIAEAVEIANEQTNAIKAKAEEEAALLLEHQRNKIRGELHNLVNQQFGYMLEELENLKQQAAAVQADFGNKLSEPGEEKSNVPLKTAEERDAIVVEEKDATAAKITEESDAIAAEEKDAAAMEIAEESDTTVAEEKDVAAAEIAEESDTTVAEEKDVAAAEIAEEIDTIVTEEITAAAAEIVEERDTAVAEEKDVAAMEIVEGSDTTVAEESKATDKYPKPNQATDYIEKTSELAKLLQIEDPAELSTPQWEMEILPPFDIAKIMEVVSFLDQLPEVANTEMIVPQIDMPSILVFLREPMNFVDVLQTIPAVTYVEEVTTDTAATNGKPRKVRIALSGNTTSQKK